MCLGALQVRSACVAADHGAVQVLRGQRFHKDAPHVPDEDSFDPFCTHLMVEPLGGGTLLATARLRPLVNDRDFATCYTAQSYDLRPIAAQYPCALEIGRLCLAPGDQPAADILRALLAGITAFAVQSRAQVLIGCASFHGADVARHSEALAYLRAQHLGPSNARPCRRAEQVVALPADEGPLLPAAKQVPPLLRMYLAMGGWVSDHAVIDCDLDTLHVLVAVPVGGIPPARLRALGALLGAGPLPLG